MLTNTYTYKIMHRVSNNEFTTVKIVPRERVSSLCRNSSLELVQVTQRSPPPPSPTCSSLSLTLSGLTGSLSG